MIVMSILPSSFSRWDANVSLEESLLFRAGRHQGHYSASEKARRVPDLWWPLLTRNACTLAWCEMQESPRWDRSMNWRWLIAAAVVFGVASWTLYALSILAEGQQ